MVLQIIQHDEDKHEDKWRLVNENKNLEYNHKDQMEHDEVKIEKNEKIFL